MKPDLADQDLRPGTLVRCLLAGCLMGMANLVPGISGGTMLVAAGVYRRFIDAVSDVSRFRLRRNGIIVLAAVCFGAGLSIASFSGLISYGLTEARWAMYSVFIGLTLGGAPVLWNMLRPVSTWAWAWLVIGIIIMLGVTALQTSGSTGGMRVFGPIGLAVAGAAGASAMILPGISGAYLLLLLGAYEPIIDAIKDAMHAAIGFDVAGVIDQLGIIVPVGIGVVIGVIAISNVLRVVLHRYEKATLGFLLGLLLAAPAGLYPFVRGVAPEPGQVINGKLVTEDNREEFGPKDWNVKPFRPTPLQVAESAGLAIAGFAMTLGVARLGRSGGEEESGAA